MCVSFLCLLSPLPGITLLGLLSSRVLVKIVPFQKYLQFLLLFALSQTKTKAVLCMMDLHGRAA
jgi:hypothetical protein